MKMKPADYELLRSKIAPMDTRQRRENYRREGLSARRYRWDLFYLSQVRIGDGVGIIGDINDPDLTDDHIDTALRRICGMNQTTVIPEK